MVPDLEAGSRSHEMVRLLEYVGASDGVIACSCFVVPAKIGSEDDNRRQRLDLGMDKIASAGRGVDIRHWLDCGLCCRGTRTACW